MDDTGFESGLAGVERALAITEGWRQAHGGEYTDRLDASVFATGGPLRDFQDGIQTLIEGPHQVQISVRGRGFVFSVLARDGCYTVDGVDGNVSVEMDGEAIQICVGDDGQALVDGSGAYPCRIEATLNNVPSESGLHWVRKGAGIAEHMSEVGWCGLAFLLFEAPFQHRRLVVGDAGAGHLETPGLRVLGIGSARAAIAGPPADTYPPDLTMLLSQARHYAAAWLDGERRNIPPPLAFAVRAHRGFDQLARHFNRIAHCLTWLWLASSAEIAGASVRVRFEGSRWFALDMDGLPPEPFQPEALAVKGAVDLWGMAVASPDTLRHEAVQRAFALSVRDDDGIYEAAPAVLSLADYFHNLAQQGLVAEALAALRSARQEASDAASASADAIRTASRTVVDRVFTQLAGSIGILLAKLAQLIPAQTAGYLALAVLVLSIMTALVAFLFEYPGVERLLRAFEEDLENRFRGRLRREDIDQIKASPQLKECRRHLRRARITAGVIFLLVAGWLGLLIWLWL